MEVNDADREAIRRTAYYKWLDAGAPVGDGVEYWLAAEWEYLHTLDEDRQSRADGEDRSRAFGKQADEFEFQTSQQQRQPAPAARSAARDREKVIGSRG